LISSKTVLQCAKTESVQDHPRFALRILDSRTKLAKQFNCKQS
jgi:hypothetical protein